jgi:hypothetical protein
LTGREAKTVNGALLGFGVPGLREILVVGMVILALYGRNGSRLLMATKSGRTLAPWLDLVRIPTGTRTGGRKAGESRRGPSSPPTPASAPKRPGRFFWALALMAAAAGAAVVATRMVIQLGAGPSPH